MRGHLFLFVAACGGGSSEPLLCGAPGELVDVQLESDLDALVGCTTHAGSLRFGDTAFTSLGGLEQLRTIEGTLNLFRNPSLVDLDGLRSLERVGGELLLHHNGQLANGQLGALREVGELLVSSNGALAQLGLASLETVAGDLTIIGNPVLSQSAAEAFAAGVDVGGTVDVSNNQ